jgi:hypothetical protein
MAGQVSQSESQVIYRRLSHVAVQLLSLKEEIDRLDALNTSLNLGTNLEAESGGQLTVAQAGSLFTELTKYRDWFNNLATAATSTSAGGARRAILDPFILAEPLI